MWVHLKKMWKFYSRSMNLPKVIFYWAKCGLELVCMRERIWRIQPQILCDAAIFSACLLPLPTLWCEADYTAATLPLPPLWLVKHSNYRLDSVASWSTAALPLIVLCDILSRSVFRLVGPRERKEREEGNNLRIVEMFSNKRQIMMHSNNRLTHQWHSVSIDYIHTVLVFHQT